MHNEYTKYPRTLHFPFSEGVASDDKIQTDLSYLENTATANLEKMDGENTTMYSDYIHARSLDSNNHESRNFVKGIWGTIKHDIPFGWRICGENLYAKHSIGYDNLESYFNVFSIWNEHNVCLSLKETLEFCELLGLVHVPILYEGVFDINHIKSFSESLDLTKQEGFVVRNTNSFDFKDFNKNVIKWVRKNHVNTDTHWMNAKIIPNTLKNK